MPLPNARRHLGEQGEATAAAYLLAQGYTLLERNWRFHRLGEIDLIARQGEQVVFVEVRTRHGKTPDSPTESITLPKQKRLIALAYTYLETHAFTQNTLWRIDVIALNLDNQGQIIALQHICNAIEEH